MLLSNHSACCDLRNENENMWATAYVSNEKSNCDPFTLSHRAFQQWTEEVQRAPVISALHQTLLPGNQVMDFIQMVQVHFPLTFGFPQHPVGQGSETWGLTSPDLH